MVHETATLRMSLLDTPQPFVPASLTLKGLAINGVPVAEGTYLNGSINVNDPYVAECQYLNDQCTFLFPPGNMAAGTLTIWLADHPENRGHSIIPWQKVTTHE